MPTSVLAHEIAVRGTTLYVEERGSGPAVLLIHGGGEDSSMLAGQADALALAGHRVLTYDRRGTGRSGRQDWPAGDADQHADDASALLDALDATPCTVLGLSSGGVVALALAARHPEVVARALSWEPPALGAVPDGEALNAEAVGPVFAHLEVHPGDYVGAQAVLLSMVLGFPVRVDDPMFAPARANAEPMVRDDTGLTLRRFTAGDLRAAPVTIAIGSTPNDVVGAAVSALAALTGDEPLRVDGADHQVYLTDPPVLAAVVTDLIATR
jgi:pimeloyl-ACP methyl ester carboxylesterase